LFVIHVLLAKCIAGRPANRSRIVPILPARIWFRPGQACLRGAAFGPTGRWCPVRYASVGLPVGFTPSQPVARTTAAARARPAWR